MRVAAPIGSTPLCAGVEDTGSGVPKWVWGVAIGVPVAAALAYILFGGSSQDPKKKSKKTGKSGEAAKQDSTSEARSHEGETAKPVEEVKTPVVEKKAEQVFSIGQFTITAKCTL